MLLFPNVHGGVLGQIIFSLISHYLFLLYFSEFTKFGSDLKELLLWDSFTDFNSSSFTPLEIRGESGSWECNLAQCFKIGCVLIIAFIDIPGIPLKLERDVHIL